jgi:hypothetical protein
VRRALVAPGSVRRTRVGLCLVAAMTCALLSGTPARAASTCHVRNGKKSYGRLQIAIDDARSHDTLVVSGTCYGAFFIAKPLTLVGTRGATLDKRVFTGPPTLTSAATPVVLRGLRILGTGSVTSIEADVVFNYGKLIVRNSEISASSSADEWGGTGIKNAGTLTVIQSDLRADIRHTDAGYYDVWNLPRGAMKLVRSRIFGGTNGIYNQGTTRISRSTISGTWGMGWDAGGIWNDGEVTVFDSTIMQNESINSTGYGIQNNGGNVYVIRSTIASNSDDAGDGGDVANVGGEVSLTGSILGSLQQDNCVGTVMSLGYNIVAGVSPSNCPLTAQSTDQVGTGSPLGPLSFNGGLTRTSIPLLGSPAIDQIPVGAMTSDSSIALCPASGSLDQRGVARPQGAACDIGAVEVQP